MVDAPLLAKMKADIDREGTPAPITREHSFVAAASLSTSCSRTAASASTETTYCRDVQDAGHRIW